MNIKEIKIINFRSYYGENTIQFNDGLNLFIGDNGDGKTTFFEALEWLFDTTKQNMDIRYISEKRISEISEFENDIVQVTMKYDHDGEKIIEKSFVFKKDKNNEILKEDFQFKGWYNHGSERIQIQGGVLLDRNFDAAIRKYCMFKGEENLNVFNNPDALSYLIETFSNIREFDPFYTGDFDNKGFTDFAEELSRKTYEKAMKSDKDNSQQERTISYNLDIIRGKLGNIKQRLKTNRENFNNYSNKLDEIEHSKEASTLLKEINERIKSLNEKKEQMEKLIDEEYTTKLLDEMWILCGFVPILKDFQNKVNHFSKNRRLLEDENTKKKGKEEAYNEIKSNFKKGIVPLSIYIPNEATMKEMIEDEVCKVCGRDAEKGSEAYNFMINKLNELIKSQESKITKENEPFFQNNFSKELEQKAISLGYIEEELNNLLKTINDKVEFNNTRKQDVKNIQNSINIESDNKKKILAQNDNFTEEQLENSFQNIKNWFDNKGDAERQIYELEKDEKDYESQLNEEQEKYNKLAKTSIANSYSKIHSVFNKIHSAFKFAKEKNTQDFLQLLEETSNKYLEKLNTDGFYGIIRIVKTHDNSARIYLEDKNGTFISNPNQALKTTMYMSVLFAISDLTTIKREDDFPLIFDAPTSSFSPQKENEFFNVISDINKQCIIFSKSFLKDDGALDEQKIDSLHCKINRMSKKKPFDKHDLSTIETEIIPIK